MPDTIPVQIDLTRCIGCGLCKNDCVAGAITLENGKAVVNPTGCIRCGHCEAICPKNAAALTGFTDTVEEFDEQTRLDPKQLMDAIRTRRTIRSFTADPVPAEVTEMILEAGRLAPTGANAQRTSYVVLQNKKDECEAAAVAMFRKLASAGGKVIPFLRNMVIDDSFFFKKAPLVIVIFGKDAVSASLAAENMAFMAEANGLGVLYSGFFTTCVNRSRKLRGIMGIGKEKKAVTTLVLGYPAVKYRRTAHRKPLDCKYL